MIDDDELIALLRGQADVRTTDRATPSTFTPGRGRALRVHRRPGWVTPLLAAACVCLAVGATYGSIELIGAPAPAVQQTTSPTPQPAPTGDVTRRPVMPPTDVASRTGAARPVAPASSTPGEGASATGPGPDHPSISAPVTAAGGPVHAQAAPSTRRSSSAATARPCTTGDLAVTVHQDQGAGGQFRIRLMFENSAAAPCTLTGYPGVAVLDAQGRQQFQARRTPNGYSGGIADGTAPPTVTLATGQTATAVLEGGEHDQSRGGADCPSDSAVLVTAPGTDAALHRVATVWVCQAPTVHPVVKGTTGIQGGS